MSGGGLTAIPVYDIERHYWLHAIRQIRAMRKHGSFSDKTAKIETKLAQSELCKTRSKHYGGPTTDKPVAKTRKA